MPKYTLANTSVRSKKIFFLLTSQNHNNETHSQQKVFVIKVDRECRLLAGDVASELMHQKKRQTFFLYSRLKKSPQTKLEAEIFIRMIAEIISFDVRSFPVRKALECKKLSEQWENCSDGSISGETSDAINHQRRPAARDCSRSAIVEVAPRKSLLKPLRKLSKTRRLAIVANIFQITAGPCRNYDQITDCACRIGKFME